MAFGEVLLLLLALGGFGVAPNPNPPPVAEVARYSLDDADGFAFLDAGPLVGPNWTAFTKLPEHAQVKTVPKLQGELVKMIKQAEAQRADVKKMIGIDPVTDLSWGAAWVRARPQAEPDMVAVVRGRFPADFVDRVAPMIGGKVSKVDGRNVVDSPDGKMTMGLTADGTLVMGTASLVRPRLGAGWKPSGRAGTVTALSVDGFADKPFFFLASRPGALLLKEAKTALKQPDELILLDLATGHEYASFHLSATGFGWSWTARTPSGFARAVMASDGMIQLTRSSHLFFRGAAQVLLAGIDSYASADPSIPKIIRHKAELLRMVEAWSGDGNFAAKVDKDPARRRLSVRLSGRSLSESLPAGGVVLTAVAAGFVAYRSLAAIAAP